MGMKRVLILALALAACRSAGTDPGEQMVSGDYEWIGSTGGIAGRTMTPASEGYGVRSVMCGGPESGVHWRQA